MRRGQAQDRAALKSVFDPVAGLGWPGSAHRPLMLGSLSGASQGGEFSTLSHLCPLWKAQGGLKGLGTQVPSTVQAQLGHQPHSR